MLSIISCEAATLDYSNITPWSVVYAVYPVYDSQPWADVWKNERSLDISDNRIEFRSNDRQRSDSKAHKDVPDNNDSQQNSRSNIEDNQHLNSNQQSQTHLWPLNYVI